MKRARLACVLASAIALMAATARAQAGSSVAAVALFDEGVALQAQGRIDEACDRFTRSRQLEPRVGTLVQVGKCFELKQQYASAWGAFREAVNLAIRQHDDREALARELAENAEKRAARLTLAIDPTLTEASVTRNGAAVDHATFNTSIPVDPGPQVVVVTAPNRRPWQSKVHLREGEVATLRVPTLEVLVSARGPERPADEHPGTTQSKVALGLEIGGGVVLATGLVFGALAITTWSSVEQTCPRATCPNVAARDSQDATQRRASTFATVSTVSTVLGGAALVTGIILHLTAPPGRLSVAPSIDRTSGGLLATLRL